MSPPHTNTFQTAPCPPQPFPPLRTGRDNLHPLDWSNHTRRTCGCALPEGDGLLLPGPGETLLVLRRALGIRAVVC
eukprot:scaffold122056_cov27-Tisochrysis_lutea.AAC.4